MTMMMHSYHRLWLSVVVLAILTTKKCGLAHEIEIAENTPHMQQHDEAAYRHLEAQAAAAAAIQEVPEASGVTGSDLWNSLRFEPEYLDFGIGTVGTIHSHVVTLVNQNRNRSVYLSSVSGKIPSFYSSFYEAKMIPPNGNTTFNVVFLPREQGRVSTSLNINTSFGKLKLLVRGEGRDCPYRLKPLVGIRAPLNATLMPEIHMYNPHGWPLQILEVYSSGGQFQLELPSGDPEAPQGLWQIPPFTTKPIIRIRFQGFTAGNYSAYIRIKIAHPHYSDDASNKDNDDLKSTSSPSEGVDEQILVIPVEFEILPEYGLYAVNPLLEFGYLAINESSKPLKQKLNLRHSKSHLEQMNNFKFESLTYMKGISMADDDTISTISIDPEDLIEPVTQLNEKLQLILKDTSATAYAYHNVEFIVRANVYKGSLHYNANCTIFLDKSQKSSSVPTSEEDDMAAIETEKILHLRNDFHIPLLIYNVTTKPHNSSISKLSVHLKAFSQESGLLLQPGQTCDLLVSLSLSKQQQQKHDLNDQRRNNKTVIYVNTNITNFEIPIVISSTHLFVTTQTQTMWRSNNSLYTKELQLSSVPLREVSQNGYVILQNRNLIPIKIKKWQMETPQHLYYSLMSRGCLKATDVNDSTVIDLEGSYELNDELQAGDVAIFVLNVTPYVTDLKQADFKIETVYENITIKVEFNTAMGRLEVDQEKLHFEECFPGKICSSELSIRSTFKQPIQIKSINFTVPGLTFEYINQQGSKIMPQAVTTVGRLYFEPSALCDGSCYVSQPTEPAAIFPIAHKDSHLNMPAFDEMELRRRIENYRHFKYYFQNIDFVMTTKDMQSFQLNLMIELQWPQLVTGRQVLTTTEVNKTRVYEVKISNPSDQAILIDYQLADPMLAKQTLISLPLEVIIMTPSCYLTDQAVFSLASQTPKKPILIPALSSIKVPINFHSNSMGSFCTILHIRNNLTLYEGIWISAKAVQSQFRFGNRKPGSQTPLLFEITEQQLDLACSRTKAEDKKTDLLQPQIVTRRLFTARNAGELPIKIEQFFIDDQLCQGYGFQVINCTSFLLKANSSKTIEIVFQSDFTVTRMTKHLILKTNLTYAVEYTLVAQLPSKGLDQCNALLVRPSWETKIRNFSVIMLVLTFGLVLIAARIDYVNIMCQSSLYGAREKGKIHPTFNLRNIAMEKIAEGGQNNNEELTNGVNKTQAAAAPGLRKRNLNKQQKQTQNNDIVMADSLSDFNAKGYELVDLINFQFSSKSATKRYLKTLKEKGDTRKCTELTYEDMKNFQIWEKEQQEQVSGGKSKSMDAYEWEPFGNTSSNKSLPMMEITNQQNSVNADCTNERKMGKTPGRERKNQQHCTKNTSSATGKKKKSKRKECFPDPLAEIRSSPLPPEWFHQKPAEWYLEKTENTNYDNVLTPWSYGSQISFNDTVEQKHETNSASPMATLNSSPTALLNTDLANHSTSLAAAMAQTLPRQSLNCKDNVKNFTDVKAFVGGKQHMSSSSSSSKPSPSSSSSKPSPTELGPIGSRKSPSSSPSWESSYNNSAITMQQLPRPLITTATNNLSPESVYNNTNIQNQQHQQHCYPTQGQQPTQLSHMGTSNYGYPEMPIGYGVGQQPHPQQHPQPQPQPQVSASMVQKQIHDEVVRLYLEQYILHQQQQQYFNYLQAVNGHWPSDYNSTSTWSPIPDNMSAASSNAYSTTWGMGPSDRVDMTTRSSARIFDNTYAAQYINSHTGSVANPIVGSFSAAVTAPTTRQTATQYNNNTYNSNGHIRTPNDGLNLQDNQNTNADNTQMFNLFGGLNTIWNDDWKQTSHGEKRNTEELPEREKEDKPLQKKEE